MDIPSVILPNSWFNENRTFAILGVIKTEHLTEHSWLIFGNFMVLYDIPIPCFFLMALFYLTLICGCAIIMELCHYKKREVKKYGGSKSTFKLYRDYGGA